MVGLILFIFFYIIICSILNFYSIFLIFFSCFCLILHLHIFTSSIIMEDLSLSLTGSSASFLSRQHKDDKIILIKRSKTAENNKNNNILTKLPPIINENNNKNKKNRSKSLTNNKILLPSFDIKSKNHKISSSLSSSLPLPSSSLDELLYPYVLPPLVELSSVRYRQITNQYNRLRYFVSYSSFSLSLLYITSFSISLSRFQKEIIHEF